jgi:hypothetical protein
MSGAFDDPALEPSANYGAETNRHFQQEPLAMHRISTLCAAAGIVLAALAATTPAKADFHLIRWHDTGFCQIWDQSIPTVPFPSNYRVVSAPVPTFLDALDVKEHMLHTGACAF